MNTKKSAISRIENHAENIRLSTLYHYTEALGYGGILDEAMKPLVDAQKIMNETIGGNLLKSSITAALLECNVSQTVINYNKVTEAIHSQSKVYDEARKFQKIMNDWNQSVMGITQGVAQKAYEASLLNTKSVELETARLLREAKKSLMDPLMRNHGNESVTGITESLARKAYEASLPNTQILASEMDTSNRLMTETMKQVWDFEKTQNNTLLKSIAPNETIEPIHHLELPVNQNLASEFYKRLVNKINHFNDNLDAEFEVGVRLINFGQTITFHLQDMDYLDPSLISFLGDTNPGSEENERVELIQHVSQISILLMKLKRIDPSQPKHPFGFAI